MEAIKGAQLPDELKHKFYKTDVIGVPFESLQQYLQLSADEAKKLALPASLSIVRVVN